jgi:hypothetical protein
MYEVCNTDLIGKHLCDALPLHFGVKQGDVLSPLLFYFYLRIYHQGSSRESEQVNSLNPGTCLCLWC